MGVVFADHQKGLELFSKWTDDWGNSDDDDSIRIAIIEGEIPGQVDGYSIHISAGDAEAEVGQVNRMHPSPEAEKLLEQFKAQYVLHGKFLFCPVEQREDGQLWFNAYAGIIKKTICFRNVKDIDEKGRDAVVLKPSEVETALSELMDIVDNSQASDSQE